MSLLLDRFINREHDERVAVIDRNGSHTYATLVRRARGVAAVLATAPGTHVAVLVETGVDFLAALYGVLLAGRCAIVLTPIHRSRADGGGLRDVAGRPPHQRRLLLR